MGSWIKRPLGAIVVAAAVAAAGVGGIIVAQPGGNGTQSCPAYPSFPDASCTGVPAGITLTTYTGPTTITTNNTVIDSKLITSGLDIQASGVVIKNSHITFNGDIDTGGDLNGIRCQDQSPCGQGATPLTVQDTEVDCGQNGAHVASYGTAIEDSNITLRRVDIHGCENGMSVDQKIDIQDSWMHDLFEDPTPTIHSPDGTHTDGIQFSCGHYTNSSTACGTAGYTPGAKDITIVHNRIEGWGVRQDGSLGAASTSAIITNRGPTNIDNNILIQHNLLMGGHNAGGGNTVYCEQDGFAAVNERVIDNHFSDALGGTYSTTDCSDESDISGNIDHESGNPITLDLVG